MTRISIFLLFVCIIASAQIPTPAQKDPTIKGVFHVNIDDSARIFINGIEAHRTTAIGKSKSKEVALKPGDRVVVQLHNAVSKRYFMMAFVSSDWKQVMSFQHQSLKVLTNPGSTDFVPIDFARLTKNPKAQGRKTDAVFPFKHNSEYIWAEFDDCALGCVITQQMFTPLPTL